MKYRQDDILLIDDDGMHLDFIRLYNIWENRTSFMSCGMFDVDEWSAFVAYAKENTKDFARFAIDYINDLGCNWIIIAAVNQIIGWPYRKDKDLYIHPTSHLTAMLYKEWCRLCIDDEFIFDENGEPLPIMQNGNKRSLMNQICQEIKLWFNRHKKQ